MDSFREFITEGRDAPLYHGTTMATAMEILKHNIIQGRTSHEAKLVGKSSGKVDGVSLSRSFRISEWFGEVVFELDQRKLTHNHQIHPVQYFSSMGPMKSARTATHGKGPFAKSGSSTEAEEFVVGSIRNATKYITKIHIPEQIYNKSPEVFERDKRFVPYKPKAVR